MDTLEKIRDCYDLVEEHELDWDMEFIESLHKQLDEGRGLTQRQEDALDNVVGGIKRLVRGMRAGQRISFDELQ